MKPDRHRMSRIVFAGFGHIDEYKLGNPTLALAKGYPRRYDAEVLDDYGILFVDVVLDHATGEPVCHEVNGSNGVGSDALTGDSADRADNETRQTLRRAREYGLLTRDGRIERPFVTVHAHQHWSAFRTGYEFYTRVDDYASLLETALPEAEVCRRGAAESLGHEAVSVVMGDVPAIVEHLAVDPRSNRFVYRGRPVAFLGNPNLMPELARVGKLPADPQARRALDVRPFHAWRLLELVHDKYLQQSLLHGTGIRPLRCFEARTREETLARTREHLAFGPVVLKPHGASGGAGVHVAVPHMTDAEILARIAAVIGDCAAKYGPGAEAGVFPLRGFEFVRSTGYPLADGPHLWDLRIAVMFEPGAAWVYPVSMRITPGPFDPETFHLDRDRWVSNVSGRNRYCLKSGMDDAALSAVGLTDETLETVFRACVRWTAKAWDAAARGSLRHEVFEDACEREDDDFYPRRKFCA